MTIPLPKSHWSPMAPPPSDASFCPTSSFHEPLCSTSFSTGSVDSGIRATLRLKHHRSGLDLYEHILVLLRQDAQVLGMILFVCTVYSVKVGGIQWLKPYNAVMGLGKCISGFKYGVSLGIYVEFHGSSLPFLDPASASGFAKHP